MNVNDIVRLFDPIRKRMFNIIGRAVLAEVNNSGPRQIMKIVTNADTVNDQIVRFQEYGLDTSPPTDSYADVLTLSIGGDRNFTVIIAAEAPNYRPSPPLSSGEVALYSKFGQTITLKSDGSIRLTPKIGADVTTDTGSGLIDGVVTGDCICTYTGSKHPDKSVLVKADR